MTGRAIPYDHRIQKKYKLFIRKLLRIALWDGKKQLNHALVGIFYLASNSISIPRSAINPMHRLIISIYLLISCLVGAVEFRTWSNLDKTKTFEAEYVSIKENQVTMRLKNFKSITMEITKLHIDDQLWIQHLHPAGSVVTVNKGLKQIDENALFDNVVFGDNRDMVTKKLYASKLVTANVAPTHIGRTGLNYVFATRDKIAGMTYSLTFGWNSDGGLTEVSLQSENISAQEYLTTLKSSWKEFEKLIISIYGKPTSITAMPKASDLQDDQMLASEVWRLDQGGSILLGTAKMDGHYQIVIRFTQEVH